MPLRLYRGPNWISSPAQNVPLYFLWEWPPSRSHTHTHWHASAPVCVCASLDTHTHPENTLSRSSSSFWHFHTHTWRWAINLDVHNQGHFKEICEIILFFFSLLGFISSRPGLMSFCNKGENEQNESKARSETFARLVLRYVCSFHLAADTWQS